MIIAGTGHRPDKLGGYTEEVHEKLVALATDWLVENPLVTTVIAGGALGWDTALAEAAIRLKRYLILALPFPGFEDRWPSESKARLYAHMAQADEHYFVREAGYAAWKMQERNKWMVDHCDEVLALWNGTSGGTSNCIAYANKVGKPINNLWEKYE